MQVVGVLQGRPRSDDRPVPRPPGWATVLSTTNISSAQLCRPGDAAPRVAARINVFGIGFPITLGVGLLGRPLTLRLMQQPFTMTLERMLEYF
jgi:hypothetical protein